MEVQTASATLADLSRLVDGTIIGSGDVAIADALPLQDACPGCLTLVDSPKHLERLERSDASAVLVSAELDGCTKPMLVVKDLHGAFQTIIQAIRGTRFESPVGVASSAVLHVTARIGKGTTVGANSTIADACVIGERCKIHAGVHIMSGCHIGNDCEIFPGVVIYEGSRLGSRITLHANSTIGAYGFGYKMREGKHHRTAQLGWVEIEDDVEVGTSTAVDRGTYGVTRIGEGTKIDNLVQIAHNVHIGKNNLICAHVGIAGSCSTGDYVVMAGQVGMADHIHLGHHVRVAGQAGVMQNVADGRTVSGSPAIDSKRKMQEVALASRLPEMRREMKAMRKRIEELTEQLAGALENRLNSDEESEHERNAA